MSIVANTLPSQNYLRSNIYTEPDFMPKKNFATGMWMYGGERGAGVTEHIDSVGCVCSWSYMLFGDKLWWFGSPPGAPKKSAYVHSEVLQRQYDFIFWCVGFRHETTITSDESLDIHGYINLDQGGPDTYAQNLTAYYENLSKLTYLNIKERGYSREMKENAERCKVSIWKPVVNVSNEDITFEVAVLLYTLVLTLWLTNRLCAKGLTAKKKED